MNFKNITISFNSFHSLINYLTNYFFFKDFNYYSLNLFLLIVSYKEKMLKYYQLIFF